MYLSLCRQNDTRLRRRILQHIEHNPYNLIMIHIVSTTATSRTFWLRKGHNRHARNDISFSHLSFQPREVLWGDVEVALLTFCHVTSGSKCFHADNGVPLDAQTFCRSNNNHLAQDRCIADTALTSASWASVPPWT